MGNDKRTIGATIEKLKIKNMESQELTEKMKRLIGTYDNNFVLSIANSCVSLAKEYHVLNLEKYKNMNVNLSKVIKSGSARNGFESDRGQIVHIIIGSEPHGYWGGMAVCGSKLRKRSNGWFKVEDSVNCEKCLDRLDSKMIGILNGS